MLAVGLEEAGGARAFLCARMRISHGTKTRPPEPGPLTFFAFKKLFNSLNLKAFGCSTLELCRNIVSLRVQNAGDARRPCLVRAPHTAGFTLLRKALDTSC